MQMVPNTSNTQTQPGQCVERQIRKDDGTCHTCEKYKRPQLSKTGSGKMECLFGTCDRQMREKLNGDGTCTVCQEGYNTSSCGKFCV